MRYKQRPSQILQIKDEYTAFCFDEACDYMIGELENKKRPHFIEDTIDRKTGQKKTFLSQARERGEI